MLVQAYVPGTCGVHSARDVTIMTCLFVLHVCSVCVGLHPHMDPTHVPLSLSLFPPFLCPGMAYLPPVPPRMFFPLVVLLFLFSPRVVLILSRRSFDGA